MIPIKYQVVGEEDYAVVITINDAGAYTVSGGTYTSDRPRNGRLSREQEESLLTALHSLGSPEQHDMPEDAADAFQASLTLGEGSDAVTYRFWEGALADDSKLLKLVRLLEMI